MSIVDQYLSVWGEVCFLVHSTIGKHAQESCLYFAWPNNANPKVRLQQTDVTFVQTAWNHSWCLWSRSDQWILCVAHSPSLTFCNKRMLLCCSLFFLFFLSVVVTASVLYCIFRKEDMHRQATWTNLKAVNLCVAAHSFKCQFGFLLVNFFMLQFCFFFAIVSMRRSRILSLLIKHKITLRFI